MLPKIEEYIDLEMCRWALTYPYPYFTRLRPSRRVLPQLRHLFHRQAASSSSSPTWSDTRVLTRISFSLSLSLSFSAPTSSLLALCRQPQVYPFARATREPSSGAVSYRGQLCKKWKPTHRPPCFSLSALPPLSISLLTPVPKTWRQWKKTKWKRRNPSTRVRPDTCS